ncbi:MAG TPA: histidine kinase [Gemmatimonadales bacterium]|nr:histidine kinase [Gemmatimonadales bacterium]
MSFLSRRGVRIVLIWLGVAAFFITQNVFMKLARHVAIDWQWDVFHEIVYAMVWAACTPVILWAADRWRLEPGAPAGFVWPHLALMPVIGLVQITGTYTTHFLVLSAIGYPPAQPLGKLIMSGLIWGVFTGSLYYWVIIGVYMAFLYPRLYQAQRAAAAELQSQLSRAQLDALRLQLHPHFLFNTLNAIAALAPGDPGRAQRMLARLGDLLRHTLDTEAAEIPVEQELKLLAPYVEIQRLRFEERFRYSERVAPETLPALVPALFLQPLVENAVQHGVSKRPEGAAVSLAIQRMGEQLVLEVIDDGPGPRPGNGGKDGNGIGLANTRARLAQLYPGANEVDLAAGPEGGARLTVKIPYRTDH